MSKDLQPVRVAFHNEANELFFSFYKRFEVAAEKISRKTDEHLFLQLQEKYVTTFRQQLQALAKELLQKNQQPVADSANKELNEYIQQYLHRFVQKIKEG